MQPKYEQVHDQLLARIVSGELAPGDKLSNELQLAQEYGVSTITIRKALSLLVASGHVNRVRGSGSFVAEAPEKAPVWPGEKRLIALMLTQESYPEMSLTRIISGVQRTLAARGCELLIDWNSSNPRISRESVERMLGQQADGFIIYPYDPAQDREVLSLIESRGKPYVLMDRYDLERPSLYVGSNNYVGGQSAANALLSMGHRKILFCGNLFFLSSEQERYAGFCRAMQAAGLPCDPAGTLMPHPDYDLIAQKTRDGEITALFCCSDRVAQSAIRELLARGIRIPLDLSVFGFDDNIYSPDNPIPLSTVRQNFEAIGHRAADLLLWRLTQEGPVPPLSLLTDTQVILRDSTRSIL